MLNPKEISQKVRANFKNIMEEHAKHNLPVSYTKDGKIINYYADGREVDVTSKYKKVNKNIIKN